MMRKLIHHLAHALSCFGIAAFIAMQTDETGYPLYYDFHGLLYLCFGLVALTIVYLTLAAVQCTNMGAE